MQAAHSTSSPAAPPWVGVVRLDRDAVVLDLELVALRDRVLIDALAREVVVVALVPAALDVGPLAVPDATAGLLALPPQPVISRPTASAAAASGRARREATARVERTLSSIAAALVSLGPTLRFYALDGCGNVSPSIAGVTAVRRR
jgi:hypothetical protein